MLGVLNQSGTKALCRQTVVYSRNQPYRVGKVQSLFFEQQFSIYQIRQSGLEHRKAVKVSDDGDFLRTFYPHKLLNRIDFIPEKQNCLLLVFKDEIVLLSTKCYKPHSVFTVTIDCGVSNIFVWGYCNGAYLFREYFVKLKKDRQIRVFYFKMEAFLGMVEEHEGGRDDGDAYLRVVGEDGRGADNEMQEMVELEYGRGEGGQGLGETFLRGEGNGWTRLDSLPTA